MKYDALLCFAQGDTAPARRLLNFLESKHYKVCFHLRDFEPGEPIADNICRSIMTSKRTLCLLSNNFLHSAYCLEEFEIALNVSVQLRRKRVIMITLETPETLSLRDMESAAALKQYVATHTYVEYKLDSLCERLLYALPQRKLGDDQSERFSDAGPVEAGLDLHRDNIETDDASLIVGTEDDRRHVSEDDLLLENA